MKYLNSLFRNTFFEVLLVLSIALSVVAALISLYWSQPWLETLNLAFSLVFCMELGLRFLVNENPRRYWKTFWLDWVASIPWDWLLLLFVPSVGLSLSWIRLLRLPRMARILRFISLGRSNLGRRVIYQFKKQLEKSFPRQFAILSLVSAGVLGFFGFLYLLLGTDAGYGNPFYFSLLTLISSDSIFEVSQESGAIKVLTIVLAFLGMVLFNGILIAIIVTRVNEYLEEVRQGRGLVAEKEHLVILGWHGLASYLLAELELYCRNEGRTLTVVFLVENMGQEIRALQSQSRLVDVVVRRGSLYRKQDLQNISVHRSRRVFVLGRGSLYGNTSVVVKSFLTLKSLFLSQTGTSKSVPGLILNLSEDHRDPQALLQSQLGQFGLEGIISFDPSFYSAGILSSVLAQPDLVGVYDELFSFAGQEFYFVDASQLEGQYFQDIAAMVDGIKILGIQRNGSNQSKEKSLLLGPRDSAGQIQNGDHLLVLGPSKQFCEKKLRAIKLTPFAEHSAFDFSKTLTNSNETSSQATAIIGVNTKIPFLIHELKKNTERVLLVDDQSPEQMEQWFRAQTGSSLPLGVEYRQYSLLSSRDWDQRIPLAELDRIIILADESAGGEDPGLVDADTLFKVLNIQSQLKDKAGENKPRILAEILSPDSEEATRRIPGVEFVIGTRALGRILASYLIDPSLESIFRQIIQQGGLDLKLVQLKHRRSDHRSYHTKNNSNVPQTPTARELTRWAAQQGQAFLGWLRQGKVMLNPPAENHSHEDDKLVIMVQN